MDTTTVFISICLKYSGLMNIHAGDGFYARLSERDVVVPAATFETADDWDVFALLHEIGHIMTNKPTQKRCVKEYLATQWALEEASKLGFIVERSYIENYQDYIWWWREMSTKLRGKNVPGKEDLTLHIPS